MKNKTERIRELVRICNEAARAYYSENREIMSNREYDALYDELEALEKETGLVLSDSPTVRVGYEVSDALPKERHESPMLSLDKTKSEEELAEWLSGHEGLLSWKLDGLTIALTYRGGQLVKAVTRGSGEEGEVVTANARAFQNLPLTIPFKGELVLRGEAVIGYEDFRQINDRIPEETARYKNPRNLCSGSVRQLNSRITAERRVRFFAFSLVHAAGVQGADGFGGQELVPEPDFGNSRGAQLRFLEDQGFDVVEYRMVREDTIGEAVRMFESRIETYDIPSDGLVLTYEDIAYGQSLGRTAKFPRDSIAFKWMDEKKETRLLEIEWSASRTGLINPVAIFEPVELEGTTVSRASVHNISILRSLKLGLGDRITVYKANMIIPQIGENLTESDTLEIPAACPVCGEETRINGEGGVQTLICTNPVCPAKHVKSFALFVSRDAMNIDGMSEATLEKFIGKGFLHSFTDLFHLKQYREEIIGLEGFGEKSYEKLMESIERARSTTLPRLLYACGIANIGVATARLICRHFEYDTEKIRHAQTQELEAIDGIGSVIAETFVEYMSSPANQELLEGLLAEVVLTDPIAGRVQEPLKGLSFVVTGSLEHFESRSDLKEKIEALGGRVTGSVTAKTVCLINNDPASASSKNKKAKELQIPIVTEEEFMRTYLNLPQQGEDEPQ